MIIEKINTNFFTENFSGIQSVHFDDMPDDSFFNNLATHNELLSTLIPKEILDITKVYPPNIAIIDFVVKNIKPSEFQLLDYGCGIPKLLQLLNHVGYTNLCGVDNWSQVDKKFAEQFIQETNLSQVNIFDNILDVPETITAISHIGYPLVKKDFHHLVKTCKNLKYIFADFRFTPKFPLKEEIMEFENKMFWVSPRFGEMCNAGFFPVCIYDGLIVVYKKFE